MIGDREGYHPRPTLFKADIVPALDDDYDVPQAIPMVDEMVCTASILEIGERETAGKYLRVVAVAGHPLQAPRTCKESIRFSSSLLVFSVVLVVGIVHHS